MRLSKLAVFVFLCTQFLLTATVQEPEGLKDKEWGKVLHDDNLIAAGGSRCNIHGQAVTNGRQHHWP